MHHEYHRWYSPALGREMGLEVVGHDGARVLVFPTSMGSHHEWLDRRMHQVLADHIEQGWIQLFLVDHLPGETWYAEHLHPGARAWRFLQYDHYLASEVLPFTASRNGNPFLIATGASLGAYYAACLGFRHPHLVNRIVGMSGTYDIRRLTGGYSDHNVYACNPVEFLALEHEPWRLEALRRQDIIMAVGRTDPAYPDNEALSAVLWSKGIGNALRVWDGWAHDWPYWERMIRLYIGGHD